METWLQILLHVTIVVEILLPYIDCSENIVTLSHSS